MIKTVVARRYARALFELLDSADIEATRETLNGLGQVMKESGALRYVTASPVFSAEEKISVLTELSGRFGCPPEGKAFLEQVVRKNRIRFLPEIAEAFGKLVDQSKGVQQVSVSSATELSQAERDRTHVRLRDALKRDVVVTFHTDTNLLAGLRIQVGNMVVDGTVRGRLNDIQAVLTRE